MRLNRIVFWCLVESTLIGLTSCMPRKNTEGTKTNTAPCIVNIINFVRQTEPRPVNISDEDLFTATYEQLKLLKKYGLKGTFLLQYDALINPRYQQLMQEAIQAGCEIGAWWEITQPHIEAAGMQWRGAYPWDWHANVGFSTGYTPAEREKLVDVYMEKFKELFGKYPTAVGSWFIDAHTLQYLADKYQIVASCNCRDQVGTDGYTLWGGYWNQAYYPSKQNAYMPAQNKENQIEVPIFRMLGSDPVNQYDNGVGYAVQGVETLEPVYTEGGGNPDWIDWFFGMLTNSSGLNFQYTQVGQENSFAWPRMQRGLEYQIPLVDSLARLGKLTVQTLSESGAWFKENFPVTPPTSISALKDCKPANRQSVWFNSRFYRANLLWSDSTLRFRDIHLFDERYPSAYLTEPGTSTQCLYTTLPFVDGFNWSSPSDIAGLRLKTEDGSSVSVGTLQTEESSTERLVVTIPILSGGICKIIFEENTIRISLSKTGENSFLFSLNTSDEHKSPFTSIQSESAICQKGNFVYRVKCIKGKFEKGERLNLLNLIPDKEGNIVLDMSVR